MEPMADRGVDLVLACDGQYQAAYSAIGNAVQVRVGHADLRMTPAEFLALCATLLKAARTLGQQPYIPGLEPPARAGAP